MIKKTKFPFGGEIIFIALVLLALPLAFQAGLSVVLLFLRSRLSLRISGLVSLGAIFPLLLWPFFSTEYIKRGCLPADFDSSPGIFLPFVKTSETESHSCDRKDVFRSSYSIDALGRRKNGAAIPLPAPNLILTTGCSFTFGLGVNDGETLAAHLEKVAKGKVRALNLGISGGGLQHVVAAYFSRDRLAPELKTTKKVVIVYTMLQDHLHRLSHSGNWGVSNAISWDPVFSTENGIRYEGNYSDSILPRFLRWKLGKLRHQYFIETYAKWFNQRRTERNYATKEEVRAFVSLLNLLAEQFYRDYPTGEFVLNYWPIDRINLKAPDEPQEAIDYIRPLVDPRISILAFPAPNKLPRFGRIVPDHPKPEAYERMAGFLWRHLEKTARD